MSESEAWNALVYVAVAGLFLWTSSLWRRVGELQVSNWEPRSGAASWLVPLALVATVYGLWSFLDGSDRLVTTVCFACLAACHVWVRRLLAKEQRREQHYFLHPEEHPRHRT